MKARYRNTIIGFIWVVLNPILMYLVQAFVFKKFLKLDLPNYYIFLLGGLLPWIFINSCWDSCTSVIVNSSNLLKSFQISPFVILLSALLDNIINFLAALILTIVPMLLISNTYSYNLLLLPLAFIVLILFTSITTSILAILNVFYRDIKYVTNFLMSILFFLTPIFYPLSYIPQHLQWVVSINPFYMIIAPFRSCLYNEGMTTTLLLLAKGGVVVIALAALLNIIWKNKKNELFHKI